MNSEPWIIVVIVFLAIVSMGGCNSCSRPKSDAQLKQEQIWNAEFEQKQREKEMNRSLGK
jgi:hypothetical protein